MKQLSLLLLAIGLMPLLHGQQSSPLQETINKNAAALLPKVIEWRRYIHEHPELGNREFKTMAYIAEHCRKLGLEVTTNVGKTGVVALLKGGKPGPVVALRADMDGLPVKERTDVPYKSVALSEYNGQTVPVMHACGHDTHVAMLMGTAELLAGMKKDVPGTVKFIFQPAEEGPPVNEEGGAPLMIKEGVMDNPKVDAIFGIHIASQTEAGKIKYRPGAFQASSDWFTIKIKGKQSHGSMPWYGIDPIVIGSQIIAGIQTIVSRQENLTVAPLVITVGKFNSGVRANILPESAELEGTIRTLDKTMQKDVHERLRQTVTKIAESAGATVDVNIETKTLVNYNDPELVKMMLPSLERALGKENVEEENWTTAAEDFSFFGEKAPSFFFSLGGMPKGMDPKKASAHHTPDFFIDDSQLDAGVKAFSTIVFDYAKFKTPNSGSEGSKKKGF